MILKPFSEPVRSHSTEQKQSLGLKRKCFGDISNAATPNSFFILHPFSEPKRPHSDAQKS